MPYLLVKHGVKDFDRWNKVFSSDRDGLTQYGMKLEWLMRDINDSNMVVFMFEVESIAKAEEFMNLPGREKVGEEAGVTGEPLVMFLDTIK